jgi:hypothetical protein
MAHQLLRVASLKRGLLAQFVSSGFLCIIDDGAFGGFLALLVFLDRGNSDR